MVTWSDGVISMLVQRRDLIMHKVIFRSNIKEIANESPGNENGWCQMRINTLIKITFTICQKGRRKMAGKKNGKHARCILRSSCRFFLVHDRNVRNLLSVVVAVPAHLLFVHFYRILSNLMRMYYNSYLKRITAWGYKFTSEDIFELALLLQRTMIQSFIDENR